MVEEGYRRSAKSCRYKRIGIGSVRTESITMAGRLQLRLKIYPVVIRKCMPIDVILVNY